MVQQQLWLVVTQMMARKLWAEKFINILIINLVWSRPKYGIFTIAKVIAESLIRPCQAATMSLELACILSPRGSAAIIYEISTKGSLRRPKKSSKQMLTREGICMKSWWPKIRTIKFFFHSDSKYKSLVKTLRRPKIRREMKFEAKIVRILGHLRLFGRE